MTPNPVGQEGQGLASPGRTVSVSELPDPGAGILSSCPHRMGGGPAAAQSLPRSQEPPRGVGGGLTRARLPGSPPRAAETGRAMGLMLEALLGRRVTGGGRPVRLRSTPSGLLSGGPGAPLTAREPLIVGEQALSWQEGTQ